MITVNYDIKSRVPLRFSHHKKKVLPDENNNILFYELGDKGTRYTTEFYGLGAGPVVRDCFTLRATVAGVQPCGVKPLGVQHLGVALPLSQF